MNITITIPDQVYQEDPAYAVYFRKVQEMVNRMAVSHFKYGRIDSNAKTGDVQETRCALQRLSMYDPRFIRQDAIWRGSNRKPLDTGNTENLLDAANFLIIEAIYPKHPTASFSAQTSEASPGLVYGE